MNKRKLAVTDSGIGLFKIVPITKPEIINTANTESAGHFFGV